MKDKSSTCTLSVCFCTLQDCRPLCPESNLYFFLPIQDPISYFFTIPCFIILNPDQVSTHHHLPAAAGRTFLCPRLRPNSNSEQSRSTATGRRENFENIRFIENKTWFFEYVFFLSCWIVKAQDDEKISVDQMNKLYFFCQQWWALIVWRHCHKIWVWQNYCWV